MTSIKLTDTAPEPLVLEKAGWATGTFKGGFCRYTGPMNAVQVAACESGVYLVDATSEETKGIKPFVDHIVSTYPARISDQLSKVGIFIAPSELDRLVEQVLA